jgi:hypothetical protein
VPALSLRCLWTTYKNILFLISASGLLWGLACADEPTTKPPPNSARCEVAVVSPVSGFAECVKPRGAPVDLPPPRPPPTKADCAKHADLHLPECNQTQPGKEQ